MNIEQVSALIKSRRSWYAAQMDETKNIPNEDIWKLLQNANYAPSHKRTEPWRFIVFDPTQLNSFFDKMAEIYLKITMPENVKADKLKKYKMKAETLSHVIAICMKRDTAERIPMEEEEYAVACAVQNMLLSLNSLNIIGYWSTGKLAFAEETKTFLKLSDKDKCMGFLQLGVPKKGLPELPKIQMSGIETKVSWI
ncbi:MAG: nitroreductase [Verrucomicrobia bacterium]|nr:nitroreductase [Verrucomicrobiota bacterium]